MDTSIAVGKSRTATVVFKNAKGQVVAPPDGWELTGARQWWDGGHLRVTSTPTSITATVPAGDLTPVSDYQPPRSAMVEVFIAIPGGKAIQLSNQVALLAGNSSSLEDNTAVSAELVWGPEQ